MERKTKFGLLGLAAVGAGALGSVAAAGNYLSFQWQVKTPTSSAVSGAAHTAQRNRFFNSFFTNVSSVELFFYNNINKNIYVCQ